MDYSKQIKQVKALISASKIGNEYFHYFIKCLEQKSFVLINTWELLALFIIQKAK